MIKNPVALKKLLHAIDVILDIVNYPYQQKDQEQKLKTVAADVLAAAEEE